jgi:uncharacterized protein (DUF1330 family)
MAAYVIVEMTVTDPVRIEGYRKLAGAAVAQYGGRFLARGGKSETFDGGWHPQRLVVLEFPGLAEAKQWRASPEYRAACEIRDRVASTRMVVVEGTT